MRFVLLAVLAAAPAVSATLPGDLPITAQGRSVDSWLAMGREALEEKRYPRAMEIYLTVLEKYPGHLEAKKRLVEISAAVQAWERATVLRPGELETARSKALEAQRRVGTERSKWESELDLVRRGLEGKNTRALLASSVSLTRGSEDEFVESHYVALAKAYLEQLQDRLRAALTRGELQDPKDLRVAKGFLYYHRGLLEAALEEWQAALALDVNDQLLKEQVGWLGLRVKRKRDQERLAALVADAEQSHRLGSYDKSIEAWTGVLALEPRNEKAIEGLANAQARLKEELIAVELGRARAYTKGGRPLDALRHWVAVLELEPTNSEGLAFVRTWRSRQPDVPVIARAPRRAQAAPGDSAPTAPRPVRDVNGAEDTFAVGMAYYAQRELPQALEAMERALELNPSLRKAQVAVERIRAELGR